MPPCTMGNSQRPASVSGRRPLAASLGRKPSAMAQPGAAAGAAAGVSGRLQSSVAGMVGQPGQRLQGVAGKGKTAS